MKCPVCQAKLLPVDGELFCLQCGEAVHQADTPGEVPISLEETRDPLLRRAITDASDGAITFPDGLVVPSEAVEVPTRPAKKHAFASMRSILEPARPVSAGGGGMSMPVPETPAEASKVAAPALASVGVPVVSTAASTAAPTAAVAPAVSAPVSGATVAPAPANASASVALVAVRPKSHWLAGAMVRTWAIGVAGLVLFVAANLGVGNYFSNRVYPGVRVGNLAVGGWTFDELHARLAQSLKAPKLAAVVDGQRYELDATVLGEPSFPELERSLKEAGRSTALPLVGLVSSLVSRPVDPAYSLSDDAISRVVQKLQASVDRSATNAVAVMVDGNALVLAEKPGVKLDAVAAAAALKAAYGHAATATIDPVRVQPSVTAEAFANDVTAAQAMTGLSLQVTVKKVKYAPTAAQIAGWLVFNGPGKGVSADPAGVAAFVAAIPGTFDRVSAVDGLVAALNAHQGAALVPSAHATANPKPASIAAAWPVARYNYCVNDSSADAAGDRSVIATTLGSGGWTLGGRLQFNRVTTDCNFAVTIGSAESLKSLDPACEKQTSCRIHNNLAIQQANWAKAPASWAGTLASYRSELVNHVTGQWLGFDHPNCSVVATQTPVLSTPSVIIPGCSPKWYAVPDELQDAKVLAGF